MAEQKDVEIVRANAEQSKNFIDIGVPEKSKKDEYYKKLVEKQQECTANYVPFCNTCAKNDFDDEIKRVSVELSRSSFTKDEKNKGEKKIPLNLKSLDEYSKLTYFTLVDVKTVKEQHVVEGAKISRPAYQEYNYKCKQRNHGLSVHVPYGEHLEKEKAAGRSK
ncbi:MAG: hypothetical protein Q7R52_01845 [archaeon]|nr:hypothetical protein [archaeon]